MPSSIYLKEVITKKEQIEFVKFPLFLYKDCPYFAPPILKEELANFDKNVNPVFQHAWIKQFLAYKNNKIVGRIAILYNENETKIQGILKMRFGWFDCVNDIKVAQLLFDKVEELAKEKKLVTIEGPLGFSNLDKAGMLTYGFDKMATLISTYNYNYYPLLLEKLGYVKEKEWIEFIFKAPNEVDNAERLANIIEKKFSLTSINFKNKKEIYPYVDDLFKLIADSHSKLRTYVPLSKDQAEYYKKKYLEFINPDFIKCVVDAKNKMVGFAIIMPSYVKALQKAKGKLLPFGWYHLLQAQKNNPIGELVLIGVVPKYQKKGVTAILFREIQQLLKKLNIKTIESNPLLSDNKDSMALWAKFNPVNHKKRNTFIKKIGLK